MTRLLESRHDRFMQLGAKFLQASAAAAAAAAAGENNGTSGGGGMSPLARDSYVLQISCSTMALLIIQQRKRSRRLLLNCYESSSA